MSDCAGCRYLDESSEPGGKLFCKHPVSHGLIADPTAPPCQGVWYADRFLFPGETSHGQDQ